MFFSGVIIPYVYVFLGRMTYRFLSVIVFDNTVKYSTPQLSTIISKDLPSPFISRRFFLHSLSLTH